MSVMEVDALSHSEVMLRAWQELDVPEGWRAEIIGGGLFLMPPPKDKHNAIVAQIQKQIYREILRDGSAISDADVHQAIDVRIPALGDVYIPDLVILPGPLTTRGEDHSAANALLIVEVASMDNADRDRKAKRWGYAHAPAPLYLLVDRWDPDTGAPAVTLFAEPVNGAYTAVSTTPFGTEVPLPEPFGITLDTSGFPAAEGE